MARDDKARPAISSEGALITFLHEGNAVLMSSRNGDMVPSIARVWGPLVCDSGQHLELLVPRADAGEALTNLDLWPEVGVNFASPMNYRSVQLKGRCVEMGACSDSDRRRGDVHREAFFDQAEALGLPRERTWNLWSDDFVRVRILIDEIYEQTPGPRAGESL